MEYTGEKESHEIEIEDLELIVEGFIDGEPSSSNPASKMEYYFFVNKAFVKTELGDTKFKSECSLEFLNKLNAEYEQEITKQIKEG